MPWLPDVPIDHGADVDRPQPVGFTVLHRTVGSWPGDYSVGRNRLHSSPGTFNYLVGADQGQWVQFYESTTRCSHAAGGNDGPGIEFSGQNGAPLTEWQIHAGGHIIRSLAQIHSIPLNLYDGQRRPIDDSGYRGFVTHRAIATAPQWQHYDYVTGAEFDRMCGGAGVPADRRGGDGEVYLIQTTRAENYCMHPYGKRVAVGVAPGLYMTLAQAGVQGKSGVDPLTVVALVQAHLRAQLDRDPTNDEIKNAIQ